MELNFIEKPQLITSEQYALGACTRHHNCIIILFAQAYYNQCVTQHDGKHMRVYIFM